MNPLAILGSILIVVCLLAAFTLRKTPVRAPIVSPIAPPPARSDLSCFVRGLIASLNREPDRWHQDRDLCYGEWDRTTYRYSLDDAMIRFTTDSRYSPMITEPCLQSVSPKSTPPLTEAENAAILEAVLKVHNDRMTKERVKAEKAIELARIEQAKQDVKTRARFERLGCPDGS